MFWLVMKVMTLGFEVIVVTAMALVFLGVIMRERPEWLTDILRVLVFDEIDDV